MRAAQPLLGQPAVDRAREVAVAEIEQLDAAPDLGLAQEQRARRTMLGQPC